MTDTDTITLKDAAGHFGFSVYTLRAEAGRGNLTIYKIGKRLYTTPADIRDMVSKCRVNQKAPGFGSIQVLDDALGSSATGTVSFARDALKAVLMKHVGSSEGIWPANTSRNRARRR
jgi:hypothetical protein